MITTNKNQWYISTIVYMVFLLGFSLKPAAPSLENVSFLEDIAHNSLHVPAYAILAFFLINTLKMMGQQSKNNYLLAFFISIFYGIVIEFLQSFFPGRTPSLLDVCSNAFGAGMMLWFISVGERRPASRKGH